MVGQGDVLLGEIEGCPFYIDDALDAAWRHDRFVLDVDRGDPEGFSLPAGEGLRFVTHSAGRLTAGSAAHSSPPNGTTP